MGKKQTMKEEKKSTSIQLKLSIFKFEFNMLCPKLCTNLKEMALLQ